MDVERHRSEEPMWIPHQYRFRTDAGDPRMTVEQGLYARPGEDVERYYDIDIDLETPYNSIDDLFHRVLALYRSMVSEEPQSLEVNNDGMFYGEETILNAERTGLESVIDKDVRSVNVGHRGHSFVDGTYKSNELSVHLDRDPTRSELETIVQMAGLTDGDAAATVERELLD